jgi:large conductance mechanosensitive channel
VIKGFREFILRGNVLDLAVAVVIGAAFTAVVNSIVNYLFNPLIGAVFNAKSLDNVAVLKIGNASLQFGSILAAVIQFLLVAIIVYFVFVLPINTYKNRAAKRNAENVPDEPAALTELELLTQIRDLLADEAPSGGSSTGKHIPSE